MSVKSQLNACGESLVIGIRRAERSALTDQRALSALRACLDVVERLERVSGQVVATQIEMALAILTQASRELSLEPVTAPAVVGAVRNAADRLQRLRTELTT